MWRIGDKRPSQRSSCSVLGEQLSPGEPPSKRAKVSEERINNPRRRRSWGFKISFRSAWDTVVGGFHHVFRWARRQHAATALEDMEYLHPNTPVLSQQLSTPTYTSTPSQSLTPMTSVQSTDASPVGTPHTPLLDSHTSSSQPSNHGHPETHSPKPSYSITQKPVQHRTLRERGYSNEPLSQLHKQVARKKLKEGSGQGEGRPSRETQRLATEEGPPSKETQLLATEQPVREKPRVNVDRSSLKEVRHFDDGGRSLTGRKEGVQVSAIQRTSVSHMSAGTAFGGSPYSTGVSTPANQSNCVGISLFAPILHPEVIGPSLSLLPSSRSISTTESSFTTSSCVCECSVTRQERRKSPTTISSVSQSPWQTTPLAGRVELARERGRESAMIRGEGGLRDQSAQQLNHARGRNAQQVREVVNMLERIRLEQVHSVEDRKTMAELIEKKIHLYQSERMMIEDARVSRLRQQLASTGVSQEPGRDEEAQPHIETLHTLSDSQITKVHGAISGGPSSECLSHKFNIRITRGDIGTLVGLQWLNDEVINFYFNMIKERSLEKGKAKRVHVFNTFFYSKLSQAGYSGVRRWTKKVDIFEFDMVLVPVHMGMHWCLAAIDFGTKCVSYYDSLHGNNRACLQRLRDYLNDESRDKKGVDFDVSSWASSTPKDIPHQLNGSDCGVFTCMYARFLSVGSQFHFSQADMPDIRNHMIAEILEQKLF